MVAIHKERLFWDFSYTCYAGMVAIHKERLFWDFSYT